jgi:group I intron endonuclease
MYIGWTDNPSRRFKAHTNCALKGDGFSLHKAMRKYGIENFEFEVLRSYNCDNEEIHRKERAFINVYDTLAPAGYNLTLGGDGASGYKHSEETKKFMSTLKAGKPTSEAHRKAISVAQMGNKLRLGKKDPPERIEAKRQAMLGNTNTKGTKLSEEHRKKLSEAKIGNKIRLGKKDSPERIESKRQFMIGNTYASGNKGTKRGPMSEETREKIRQAKVGKPTGISPNKGRKFSDETKAKMREAHLRRWDRLRNPEG